MRWRKTFLLLLFWITSVRAADNWPGWRGPTGMGQTDEKALPITWGGKTQDNVRWKVPLFPSDKVRRDQNQSSPIVCGKRVFVTVSYWPEGAKEKDYPEHHVMAFQTENGQKLWDVKIEPGPWKLSDLRGGYTAPTPACDGQRVYAVFGSAVIAAVDIDGNLVWRREIQPYKFDVAMAASPVLYQDTVLYLCDEMKGTSKLLAFDGKTGTIKWTKERPKADWAHSTPILAKVGAATQLVVASDSGPQGLDPASGDVLWSFKFGQRVGDTVSPVFRDGLVYVDSGRGGPGIAVGPLGMGDISKTNLKWTKKHVAEGFSSPVIVAAHIYRLHSPSMISCWELATGTEVFSERLDGLDPAVSPIATADSLIYCASAGKSFVLKAGPKLEVLARNDLGDPSRAAPAVAAGNIYLKGGKYLFCIGKK